MAIALKKSYQLYYYLPYYVGRRKNINQHSTSNNFYFVSSYINIWCYSRMMHAISEKFEYACDFHWKNNIIISVSSLNGTRNFKKYSIGAYPGATVPKHFTTGLAPFFLRGDKFSIYFISFKKCKIILILMGANSFNLTWLLLSIFKSH